MLCIFVMGGDEWHYSSGGVVVIVLLLFCLGWYFIIGSGYGTILW